MDALNNNVCLADSSREKFYLFNLINIRTRVATGVATRRRRSARAIITPDFRSVARPGPPLAVCYVWSVYAPFLRLAAAAAITHNRHIVAAGPTIAVPRRIFVFSPFRDARGSVNGFWRIYIYTPCWMCRKHTFNGKTIKQKKKKKLMFIYIRSAAAVKWKHVDSKWPRRKTVAVRRLCVGKYYDDEWRRKININKIHCFAVIFTLIRSAGTLR